ncbi:hypothetical protein [Sphingomonas asaccharolytica]|uniref:hypothetical protein n=1 Tax=Sphingomonas asaccharolytica TaxID=40681 RepID=UPI000AF7029A|nr:hypothetical protein [Sphingomonas asaccharolytica]
MAERRRAGSGTSTRGAINTTGPASPATAPAPKGAHKNGRITIEITDAMRADVRRFAEIGTPYAIIARIMGMSTTTLKRRCRTELDAGVEVANARIALTLFETAMNGNTTAMLWWEKTRAGRREGSAPDPHGIGTRATEVITPDMSAREAAERYREELG